MSERVRTSRSIPYDEDFFAWSEEQSRLLMARDAAALDWTNLAEEVGSLGRRERNEVRSRLVVLLVHLLKWQFQPERRGQSWQSTIGEQRLHIAGTLEDSPSLKSFPGQILRDCYGQARRTASLETKLPQATFPADAPFSAQQVLDETFMPGEPWSPGDLS